MSRLFFPQSTSPVLVASTDPTTPTTVLAGINDKTLCITGFSATRVYSAKVPVRATSKAWLRVRGQDYEIALSSESPYVVFSTPMPGFAVLNSSSESIVAYGEHSDGIEISLVYVDYTQGS